jgi:hypothetical protein
VTTPAEEPDQSDWPLVGYVEEEDEAADKAADQLYLETLRARTEYMKAVAAQKQADTGARRTFIQWVGGAALVQLFVADVAFLQYASQGRNWDIPTAAISAWLGATVAQVIAVLIVVANNLFPRRDAEQLPEDLVGPAPKRMPGQQPGPDSEPSAAPEPGGS